MLPFPRPQLRPRHVLRAARCAARRATAVVVAACLVITAGETLTAELADAQAMTASATGSAETRTAGLRESTPTASTAASSVDASKSAGRSTPTRGDDGGRSRHCDCPCHGACPCALLHAAALPMPHVPVPPAITVVGGARVHVRSHLAPRGPAREPAFRPPIA